MKLPGANLPVAAGCLCSGDVPRCADLHGGAHGI